MRARLLSVFTLFAIALIWLPIGAKAGYLAVSLNQVEAAVRSGQANAQAAELGGLNRILGMVVDPSGDLILVGRRDPGAPPLTVDHLAIALRSAYLTNAYPLVSLDGAPDTRKTGLLHVRFEGGVEKTQVGADLLLADLALKRLALGLLPAKLWNVPSYLELSAAANDANAQHTKFWFVTKDQARLLQRDGVFVIRRLDIAVRTEMVGPGTSDPPASKFAGALETAFPDVAAANAELARVKPLFDIVALATAIKSVKSSEAMAFWLHDYQPAAVDTPETYNMLSNSQGAIKVEGGVDLRVLSAGVAQGDTGALRQAVLLSRPSPSALSWPAPLADWPTDSGALPAGDPDEQAGREALSRHAGTSVLRSMTSQPATASALAPTLQRVSFAQATAGAMRPQSLQTFQPLASPGAAAPPPKIGGVWLAGAAQPSNGQATVGASAPGFSLLVDGEDGVLPSDRFARFVTALWSVYFSPTPPGVSIDPIAPGAPKHLVRYIGNVVNNDLAEFMRESDYLMKQLAVGSAKVNVPGFKDVDRLSGLRGLTYVGASRRFWFVPEALRFRASDGVLRFDSGAMTLKTEYVQKDGKTAQAEQADLDFAAFFTKNYDAIAQRQPIFQDLLDYAKLVGLASYLKQQRIPLLWFLMANRDQILHRGFSGRGRRHRPAVQGVRRPAHRRRRRSHTVRPLHPRSGRNRRPAPAAAERCNGAGGRDERSAVSGDGRRTVGHRRQALHRGGADVRRGRPRQRGAPLPDRYRAARRRRQSGSRACAIL